MAMKIVILEDNEERRALMRTWLQDRFYQFDVRFFDTALETIEFLEVHLKDTILISLDHDLEMKSGQEGTLLDPGDGRTVADFLATRPPGCRVVIHTTNSAGAAGMEIVLQDAGWKTSRVIPWNDLEWISTSWFPTVRRAIVATARPCRHVSPESLSDSERDEIDKAWMVEAERRMLAYEQGLIQGIPLEEFLKDFRSRRRS